MSINGLNLLTINCFPRDVHGLDEISVNVTPCDFRDEISESGLHGLNGLNGLWPGSALNGLNILYGLGPESAQEHMLPITNLVVHTPGDSGGHQQRVILRYLVDPTSPGYTIPTKLYTMTKIRLYLVRGSA